MDLPPHGAVIGCLVVIGQEGDIRDGVQLKLALQAVLPIAGLRGIIPCESLVYRINTYEFPFVISRHQGRFTNIFL